MSKMEYAFVRRTILVGNSFPISLIRREVRIRPEGVEALRAVLQAAEGGVYSFWGHTNTLDAAMIFTGCDLTPKTERPAVILSEDGYPVFEGTCFRECWLLSPQYVNNFRPQVGEEVGEDKITGWQVLKMEWM